MSRVQIGIRLVALVLVGLAGLFFIATDVLGYRVGTQGFDVKVELASGGGLYQDAYVTYRGVDVGRIAAIELTPTGVVADVRFNPGTQIPAASVASVRFLSAAGEQYLDFVPDAGHGPYLREGSVIAQGRTRGAISVSTLLNDASRFINSIDAHDVATISNALGTGFSDTGPELRAIVDTSRAFINALRAAQAATTTTLNHAVPLLSTALATNTDFSAFANSIQQITAQLASSNADVQSLLANALPAEAAVSRLVSQDNQIIEQLIGNLATFSNVAGQRQPAVVALLTELPIFLNRISSTVVSSNVQIQITYNSAETVCPYILGAETPEPTATTNGPTLDRNCTLSAADLLQRGAADAPSAPGQ